ncbi:MAG: hypothetical protein U1G05_05545 [Kiritimatiellia bacterium]
MATYKNFEDTPAWQAASVLYNLVMDLLDEHSACFTPWFSQPARPRCALRLE